MFHLCSHGSRDLRDRAEPRLEGACTCGAPMAIVRARNRCGDASIAGNSTSTRLSAREARTSRSRAWSRASCVRLAGAETLPSCSNRRPIERCVADDSGGFAFKPSEEGQGIVAFDPKVARRSDHAIRMGRRTPNSSLEPQLARRATARRPQLHRDGGARHRRRHVGTTAAVGSGVAARDWGGQACLSSFPSREYTVHLEPVTVL